MKIAGVLAAAMTLTTMPAGASATAKVLGKDAAACTAGFTGAAALVRVSGFKDRKGQVRVQVYPDQPEKFLESGQYVNRVDVPMTASGHMDVCIELPDGPGEYAMVVMHDRGSNGKLDPFSDGAGLPGNPDLKLAKPPYSKAAFVAKTGVTPMSVLLNYHKGVFGFGPVKKKK